MSSVKRMQTDVLILGSGGAGLFAALHAHQAAPNLRITVAVKGLLGKSGCTRMVQGGYNVALAAGDSIERHFMDTIDGGKWLPDQQLAWTLVTKAVERIHELENELGCFFDRNADGSVHQKAFAGQTFDRTVHKGDQTGIEIINRLAEQVWARKIERLEEHRAVALIRNRGADALAGVLLINMRDGGYLFVQAKAVLLATGGGPTMYKYHTPSGDKSCDGLAMALAVGLPLRDMEMVQFHPTGLLAGTGTRMTGTVLEEGLRGAGGLLLNGAGDRFMLSYDERAERATRDIVSRAIYAEMRAGRTSPNGGVYIDMKPLGAAKVRELFKGMVSRCADSGFDLAGGQVEVVPTAHYMMGGLKFNKDCTTALPGLFAAGEDTGGVHGANRLGGNGVANSTVFGGIAGDSMAAWVMAGASWHEPDVSAIDTAISHCEQPFVAARSTSRTAATATNTANHARSIKASGGPSGLERIRDTLYESMWVDAGISRNRASLDRAAQRLTELQQELTLTGVAETDRAFNLTWHDWLNLSSLIKVSQTIVHAAIAREDSRGAHFREDFPLVRDLERSTYTVVREIGGKIELSLEPVSFDLVQPGESLIEPVRP